jgi:hypothetical protein
VGISRFLRDFQGAVEVFADSYGTAGQGIAKACFVQLQIAVLQNDRVIVGDRSLRLDREYPIQIFTSAFVKRCPFFGGRLGESTVGFGNIVLPQKRIGLFQRADSR